MLKGFLALFTTGLIFKPMLLLGGIVGIVSYIKLDGEQLKILYTDWHLFALFLLIASLYAYFFKKTYWGNTYATDWISRPFVLIACCGQACTQARQTVQLSPMRATRPLFELKVERPLSLKVESGFESEGQSFVF